MAIKLYGSLGSDTTQRVLACLYEKEVDFELVIVDTVTGEHKTPQFLERNVCITINLLSGFLTHILLVVDFKFLIKSDLYIYAAIW